MSENKQQPLVPILSIKNTALPYKDCMSYLVNHKEKEVQEWQKTFYRGMRFHLDVIFSWDPTSYEKRQTGLCFNMRKKDSQRLPDGHIVRCSSQSSPTQYTQGKRKRHQRRILITVQVLQSFKISILLSVQTSHLKSPQCYKWWHL